MSIWTRLDRIAADVEKLGKQVRAVSNSPQSQRTSVEGGSIDFNDADGNLMAVVGGQSDGSNTIRHVDGPTPPVPAGLTSHVDGPIIQATWDGTFGDGVDATYDWSHLEILAVGPNNEQLRGTINDVTGASVSLAATTSGEWDVYARSVSRAEKRSADGDAGTVQVELTDLSGAIEDVQQSANGKNNVTYSESPPTEADGGIVGDTWFVGATDGESGNWNVVAQYQYTADGWTQVELSHEVIASVDLGKATVGELDGIRITANTIRGEQLSGDAIDGKVITGATIQSAASGARTLMSASGFETYDNAGKRTFFASATTGNVSMTGKLYTGDPGSERVTLDNSLWTSVEIVDPDTDVTYYTEGAGVRVGVDSTAGIDIYHGSENVGGGKTVDIGSIRGANSDSRTDYGSVKVNGTRTGGYVKSTAYDQNGVRAASVAATSSGYGANVRKAEMVGCDAQGTVRAYVGAFGNSGAAEIYARDSANNYAGRIILESATRGSVIRGHNSNGDRTAEVGVYGSPGRTFAEGSNINPFTVNYLGTAASWVMPFQKNDAPWGYIGSSGAMGVDEFGIQSASGKNLVLRTTSSSNNVSLVSQGEEVFRTQASAGRALVVMPTVQALTDTNAANVYISGGGGLRRVSSSLRYKVEVEEKRIAEYADQLLSIPLKTWVDKGEAKRRAEYREWRKTTPVGPAPVEYSDFREDSPRIPGVIAEEMDAAGLREFVIYDAFGRPESVAYDRLGPALIPIVRDLRDRIEELENKTEGSV